MTYIIESTCYQTGETYIEAYETAEELEQGLREMFKREDKYLSENEFQLVLKYGFYDENYDTISIRKEDKEMYETMILH